MLPCAPAVRTTAASRRTSPPAGFLTLPAPNSREFSGLARKVRLLATRALLTADFATPLRRDIRLALESIRSSLVEILQRRPDEFLSAVGSVDVLTFLLAAHCGSIPADEGVCNAVPNLLGELSGAGLVTDNIVWPLPVHSVATSSGLWSFPEPLRSLAVNESETIVEKSDRTIIPLVAHDLSNVRLRLSQRLPAATHLALHDTNPLALQEAHPDKSGNALSLGGRSAEEWLAGLDSALQLIQAGVPDWYSELPVALLRVVPVGFEAEKHLSASYREAPGLVYLSLHPDPLTIAEAIIHETQHTKLNALSWLDPVLSNGHTEWTSSPVRPDLRPLMGVLLAVHAFVPVAAMHHGLLAIDHPITRSQRFRTRRDQVLSTNAKGLDTLKAKGEPTAIGIQLLASLSQLHAFLTAA